MIQLRQNEQKILLTLQKLKGRSNLEELKKRSGLADTAVMRASLSLSSKSLIKIEELKFRIVKVNDEGKNYTEKGLPERRLLKSIITSGGKANLDDVFKKAQINSEIIPISLNWIYRKGWANLDKNKKIIISLYKEQPPIGKDEEFLEIMKGKDSIDIDELASEFKDIIPILKSRKILDVSEKIERFIQLTDSGNKIVEDGIKLVEEVSQLTPELIVSGKWRNVKLMAFNLVAPGTPSYPSKIHPVQQIIQQIREIFLEMGFTEIRGSIIETAFWNFDALFQPQDHPAREMHDTFYLEYPKTGNLPNKEIVDKVSKTHEDGWLTGSFGWKYQWDPEEAKKLVLRTHTTSTTIRYLMEHKEPPIRVFSVDRVYRNEKLDNRHLAEFNQIEGIVMEKNSNFQELIGIMKEFYKKLGLKKVQFWPSYFPYTEPSAQSTVYDIKNKRWLELCGMGMFRPEVLLPLGIKHQVLAWGGGLERLVRLKLGLDDLRILYKNDLSWIRRIPLCQ